MISRSQFTTNQMEIRAHFEEMRRNSTATIRTEENWSWLFRQKYLALRKVGFGKIQAFIILCVVMHRH